MKQLELDILSIYNEHGEVDNEALYKSLGGPSEEDLQPVGKNKETHNLFYRKVRWTQQTLKQGGLLKRIGRGKWSITGKGKKSLTEITADTAIVAFSTEFGIAIWGAAEQVFKSYIDEPVHLCFSSLPYPLRIQRAYGSSWEDEQGYLDFVCRILEPIVGKLVSGGSIVLNLSNDIFNPGRPSRSLYLERLIITLNDRFGLELMDRHIWRSNKAPSPIEWSSKRRIQLNAQYEPVLWFCNDSLNTLASIDRVLIPHNEKHINFIKSGGVKKDYEYGDGAYKKSVGDYGKLTKGKIPHNEFFISNYCKSGRRVNSFAKDNALHPHGAKMPLSLAEFYVQYLTREGDMVVDPCAGTLTLGEAAEKHGRHWICVDKIKEYLIQGFSRFAGGWVNPKLV